MARMTLYLNDAEHARLAELAEAAGVSRSGFLRSVITGVAPYLAAVAEITDTAPAIATVAPPRGGAFGKDAQAGKAKR